MSSVIVATAVAVAMAGCGSSGKTSSGASTGPKAGGSVTVLEGAGFAGNWPGLDPATDTDGAANQSYMDSIFGELFELHAGGKLVGDLATGYSFSNGGKTVNITLRQGVKFSDGTPFNAAAVVFNWTRDLNATCTCKPTFPNPPQTTPPVITATGPYSVSIALKFVDAPFINGLQGNVFNWIASPTAINKMGEKAFALKPVGAGPFTVVSDTPDSELVLKKNPSYWQKGLPYLDNLTFKSVAGDEQALTAMEAGSGQAYEGISTPQLVPTFKSKFTVTAEPGTSPYDIQLNTKIAPFNDIRAREAIYYATNAALLDKSLFNDTYPVGESFEAPAGLFYEPTVPGYLTYDLNKAKALVQQLGGLSFQLGTINVPTAISMNEAIQTEWQAAGMKVTLADWDLTGLIGAFTQGQWQAMLQTAGAYDPGTGVGVCFRFCSASPFTGVHDPTLDGMLLGAGGTVNNATRQKLYDEAAAYIAKNAYGPFLFSIAGYNAAAHGVNAPGLTTSIPSTDVNPEVLWQYAYNSG